VTLYLPERAYVPKSEFDDPVDYYYSPLTRWIYRERLRATLSLLRSNTYGALLEVGYGSGILLPELARHCKALVGLDIHGQASEVQGLLAHEGVDAELHQSSLYEMPFRNAQFDAVVCLSVLEHLTDLDRAMAEFARVARPGAVLALGFPVRNVITDSFFKLVGYNPRRLHPASHRDILDAIGRQSLLHIDEVKMTPDRVPRDLAVYCSCRCTRLLQ